MKSHETSRPIVGFVGMTHLGIVTSAAVAARGFKTVCVDIDEVVVASLSRGQPGVSEPGLVDLMIGNRDRQTFSSSLGAVSSCDVVYISEDVPTNETGDSVLSGIGSLCDQVAEAMAPHAVLVVLSQVPPGFTRALDCLPHDRLYYQVETLIFGQAVERAQYPERLILGMADPTRPVDASLLMVLSAFDCEILRMRFESAELAKISINMCLVGAISVANTLAELCEHSGAVWEEIVPALRLDKRIGRYSYLKPGLGIAGGNLERDLATVMRMSEKYGTDAGVVEAWLTNSNHRRKWAASQFNLLVGHPMSDLVITVWGLAYKEDTHSTKNSPAIATIELLPKHASLRLHDPVVKINSIDQRSIECFDDRMDALDGADVLLILTPWPEFRETDPNEIISRMAGRIIIDPYGVLSPRGAIAAGFQYRSLGFPQTGLGE